MEKPMSDIEKILENNIMSVEWETGLTAHRFDLDKLKQELRTYISNLLDSTALENKIFYSEAELHKQGGLDEEEKLSYVFRMGEEQGYNSSVAEQHKRIKLVKEKI